MCNCNVLRVLFTFPITKMAWGILLHAQPAELIATIRTCHVVAAPVLFYCGRALWALARVLLSPREEAFVCLAIHPLPLLVLCTCQSFVPLHCQCLVLVHEQTASLQLKQKWKFSALHFSLGHAISGEFGSPRTAVPHFGQ